MRSGSSAIAPRRAARHARVAARRRTAPPRSSAGRGSRAARPARRSGMYCVPCEARTRSDLNIVIGRSRSRRDRSSCCRSGSPRSRCRAPRARGPSSCGATGPAPCSGASAPSASVSRQCTTSPRQPSTTRDDELRSGASAPTGARGASHVVTARRRPRRATRATRSISAIRTRARAQQSPSARVHGSIGWRA